jgi:hypothetical protein
LDTRGWAAYAADRASYDAWHISQALGDSRLAYVVVCGSELESGSRRAASLRAILERAGERVAAFPEYRDGESADIQIYRYQRPETWEGLLR